MERSKHCTSGSEMLQSEADSETCRYFGGDIRINIWPKLPCLKVGALVT